GALSEWGATVLARESACLSRADRAALDERLCADPSRLEGVGVRALAAAARRQACALDPASVADRARRAVAHRTVTCRPAPDAMVYLTALLPVRQGVAVLAELAREAGRAAAGGDRRGRGQVMADTLVARATGRRAAAASHVEVQLVVTDRTLFQGDAEPAYLAGYGIVPAQWARDLVRDPNGT
ncbi:HNH endonuclease, partial [Arthrobacter halodurans]